VSNVMLSRVWFVVSLFTGHDVVVVRIYGTTKCRESKRMQFILFFLSVLLLLFVFVLLGASRSFSRNVLG
jgi:uncharacterized BrkB/YihY/UPF0761 family membrane protein